MSNVNDRETRICPKCGKEYSEYPALSRRDSKTEICPDCGLLEAMEDLATRGINREEKKVKKVFISQPMNGKTEQEIMQERSFAIEMLAKEYGEIDVIDSYFEDYSHESGCVPLKYLAKSIELLADADVAYFCKGWENARGCKIENECAIAYGIEVVESL